MCYLICCLYHADVVLKTGSHLWISGREGILSNVFSNELLNSVVQMYIVWSGGNQTPRFRTPAYQTCAVVMLGYVAVLVLMIIGQNSFLRADGMCIIGLKSFAYVHISEDIVHSSYCHRTIPLLSYDLFLNVFLTAMFLWPLWRSNVTTRGLRNVATRTL